MGLQTHDTEVWSNCRAAALKLATVLSQDMDTTTKSHMLGEVNWWMFSSTDDNPQKDDVFS